MSSKSSNHHQKEPTQPQSATSSSVTKNQKEDGPKNPGAFNNPSEKSPQQQYSSTSYAQTLSAYSQYQTIYLSELPSPHSWPTGNTLPSREKMDYDLLGLSYQAPSCPQYSVVAPEQTVGCPYHETSQEALQVGSDLSVMDRWMLEDGSGSGVMFAREDTGRMSTDRGCRCAMVLESGLEMANWEES